MGRRAANRSAAAQADLAINSRALPGVTQMCLRHCFLLTPCQMCRAPGLPFGPAVPPCLPLSLCCAAGVSLAGCVPRAQHGAGPSSLCCQTRGRGCCRGIHLPGDPEDKGARPVSVVPLLPSSSPARSCTVNADPRIPLPQAAVGSCFRGLCLYRSEAD